MQAFVRMNATVNKVGAIVAGTLLAAFGITAAAADGGARMDLDKLVQLEANLRSSVAQCAPQAAAIAFIKASAYYVDSLVQPGSNVSATEIERMITERGPNIGVIPKADCSSYVADAQRLRASREKEDRVLAQLRSDLRDKAAANEYRRYRAMAAP